MSENEQLCTPEDVREEAVETAENLLPDKSRLRYETAYKKFHLWKHSRNIPENLNSPSVLLCYFKTLSKTQKPSTLWATHSMINTMLKLEHEIDIGEFTKLSKFMKKNAKGYKPTQAKPFQEVELQKFLQNAPDKEWLVVKVVCIFGMLGATRTDELVKMDIHDVKTIEVEGKQALLIDIPKTKTDEPRSFLVSDDFYLNMVNQYMNLRPTGGVKDDRFFVQFNGGKCTRNVIGKNTFTSMPREIAEYLNLPEPKLYKGHSFRRTSATILANAGASVMMLKRHGGWKSTTAMDRYVENSMRLKNQTEKLITSAVQCADQKQVHSTAPNTPNATNTQIVDNSTRKNLPSAVQYTDQTRIRSNTQNTTNTGMVGNKNSRVHTTSVRNSANIRDSLNVQQTSDCTDTLNSSYFSNGGSSTFQNSHNGGNTPIICHIPNMPNNNHDVNFEDMYDNSMNVNNSFFSGEDDILTLPFNEASSTNENLNENNTRNNAFECGVILSNTLSSIVKEPESASSSAALHTFGKTFRFKKCSNNVFNINFCLPK